jgi:hypothetical protein
LKTTEKYFENAKACFAENFGSLPEPNPLMQMSPDAQLLWNLNKGLHHPTCAIEKRFDELDSRLRKLETGR